MLLNIVTIHLNDFEGLRHTLTSLKRVLGQQNTRWILVDGGSVRQTAADEALLEEAATFADAFVCEPDDGIYDAMNKGTARSSSGYLLYLNAGDELHPNFAWDALLGEIGQDRPAMIWGTCHERFADGTLVRLRNRSPLLAWYGMPVNHQNALFRRDALGDLPYDTTFRICADYDLVSRILNSGGEVYRTDMPIAIFHRGGTNSKQFASTMREEEQLRVQHYGVPRVVSQLIRRLKTFNAWAGRRPAMRRILRRWV